MPGLSKADIKTHSDTLIRTLTETHNYQTAIYNEAMSMAKLIYGDSLKSPQQVFNPDGYMDAFEVGMTVLNHCAKQESENVLGNALSLCGYALVSNLEKHPQKLSNDQKDEVVTRIQALSARYPGKFEETEERICRTLGANNLLSVMRRKAKSFTKKG